MGFVEGKLVYRSNVIFYSQKNFVILRYISCVCEINVKYGKDNRADDY